MKNTQAGLAEFEPHLQSTPVFCIRHRRVPPQQTFFAVSTGSEDASPPTAPPPPPPAAPPSTLSSPSAFAASSVPSSIAEAEAFSAAFLALRAAARAWFFLCAAVRGLVGAAGSGAMPGGSRFFRNFSFCEKEMVRVGFIQGMSRELAECCHTLFNGMLQSVGVFS